ncbi:hypothetical protein AMK16_24940 [Streptomyces sp. CB00455]|nr:hypothetical protein AMK16_24940 [Streptomyces sp. CB00455]
MLPLLTPSADAVLRTAGALTDPQVHAPSALPGWTRAHVLTHLARAADSRVRLLTAARTGADLEQYPDEATRDREIEEGARRGAGAIRSDLDASLRRVLGAIADHPGDKWDVEVSWLGGGLRPARGVLWSLLRELEVHHVDLAAGHTPAQWPDAFVARETRRTLGRLLHDPAMPPLRLRVEGDPAVHSFGDGRGPLVSGPAAEVLAWLAGRTDGSALTVEPPGDLPPLPDWKR